MSASNGIAGKAGRWSARHPWTAISLWIAFVAAAVLIGSAVGTKQLTESESASGESGVAARTLDRAGFGLQPGEQVIVQSKTLKATDPAFRAVVGDVITRLESTPNVTRLRSPYTQNTISQDGHSALVSFEIPGTFDTVGDKVEPIQTATAAAQSAHPGFLIAEAGDGSFSKAYDDTQGKDFKKAEQLSLPITLLILVIAFGGLLIAGIPVALAMSAVMAALGLTAVASQLLPVTDVTQSVILLIGLAVGVDYSIFYIARQRQERARGEGPVDAIEIAAATSGRAVLVSGLTVMAAMSGMFLAGNGVFSGIALATILVVLTAIIGSLTVLPALLAPKSAGFLARVPGLASWVADSASPAAASPPPGRSSPGPSASCRACSGAAAARRPSGTASSPPCSGTRSSRSSPPRRSWSRSPSRPPTSSSAWHRPTTACRRACP